MKRTVAIVALTGCAAVGVALGVLIGRQGDPRAALSATAHPSRSLRTLDEAGSSLPFRNESAGSAAAQEDRIDNATGNGGAASHSTGTDSEDAATRDAAIDALATAPAGEAVPALNHVLGNGTVPDRLHAVRTLGTLALQQGDAAGSVREALRQAVYHQDTDEVVQAAQSTLEQVEAALSDGTPVGRGH